MAILSTGKPTWEELLALFDVIRAYMARKGCEDGRSRAALQCTSTAMDARLQLDLEIMRAKFAGRPLDPTYIQTRRDQINEREKSCDAKVEQQYKTCMQAADRLSPVRKGRRYVKVAGSK